MTEKIPIAILGATGAVGQRFIQLLADHPWFEIAALAGSERSAGQKYGDLRWVLDSDPPPHVGEMVVTAPEPGIPGKLAIHASAVLALIAMALAIAASLMGWF